MQTACNRRRLVVVIVTVAVATFMGRPKLARARGVVAPVSRGSRPARYDGARTTESDSVSARPSSTTTNRFTAGCELRGWLKFQQQFGFSVFFLAIPLPTSGGDARAAAVSATRVMRWSKSAGHDPKNHRQMALRADCFPRVSIWRRVAIYLYIKIYTRVCVCVRARVFILFLQLVNYVLLFFFRKNFFTRICARVNIYMCNSSPKEFSNKRPFNRVWLVAESVR